MSSKRKRQDDFDRVPTKYPRSETQYKILQYFDSSEQLSTNPLEEETKPYNEPKIQYNNQESQKRKKKKVNRITNITNIANTNITNITNTNISNNHIPCIIMQACLNFSCIYVMILGTIGEFREKFKINNSFPDDHYVLKYGQTIDLYRRFNELKRVPYENIKALFFGQVDKEYLGEAENEVKENYKGQKIYVEPELRIEGCTELFCLNLNDKNIHNSLKKFYERVSDKYQHNVEKMKMEKMTMTHKIECLELEVKHLKELQESKESNNLNIYFGQNLENDSITKIEIKISMNQEVLKQN